MRVAIAGFLSFVLAASVAQAQEDEAKGPGERRPLPPEPSRGKAKR